MSKHVHAHHHENVPGCLPLPRFERVNYFYGQLLGVREFQSEQSFFLEKHRLHNRYLHGYGVVCGLEGKHCNDVKDPCAAAEQHEPREPASACIEIDCGLALDCCGNEIIVSHPKRIDLLHSLPCDLLKEFREGKDIYIAICFHEHKIDPVRPLTADGCGGLLPDCVPSRLRDDYCIKFLREPVEDCACGPCDRRCDQPCLVLAKVHLKNGHVHIHNGVRRVLSRFTPTRIESVSFVQGAEYRPHTVDKMLHDGLTIRFTADVHVNTLVRGVFDVWVIQHGGGRSGDIYNVPVKLEFGQVSNGFTREVTAKVRHPRPDRIDPGDRVLIQFRSAFVLDRCCRPVDGDNTGGFVPTTPKDRHRWPPHCEPPPHPCAAPEPHTFARPTSGAGGVSGTFDAWFYACDDDSSSEEKHHADH